jgi:hypothetical protein
MIPLEDRARPKLDDPSTGPTNASQLPSLSMGPLPVGCAGQGQAGCHTVVLIMRSGKTAVA